MVCRLQLKLQIKNLTCGSYVLFVSSVCHAFAYVHCCLVVTCWERAGLLALACDVSGFFFHFSCGVLGQISCLIVSIPDLCHLSYFEVEGQIMLKICLMASATYYSFIFDGVCLYLAQ